MAYRSADGQYRARIGADVRISIQRPSDADAVVRFEDADGVLRMTIALEVFPRLVNMIQFAALSSAPPIPDNASAPRPGGELVVRNAPGEGDGA